MLGEIVAAVKNVVVRWARSIGDTVKRLVEPANALAEAARDAVRPRSELIAESRGMSRRPTPARAPEGRVQSTSSGTSTRRDRTRGWGSGSPAATAWDHPTTQTGRSSPCPFLVAFITTTGGPHEPWTEGVASTGPAAGQFILEDRPSVVQPMGSTTLAPASRIRHPARAERRAVP